MSKCSAGPVQRPGQRILFARLRSSTLCSNAESILTSSCRKAGREGPCSGCESSSAPGCCALTNCYCARRLQSKRSVPRTTDDAHACSDLCRANAGGIHAHACQGWREHDPFRQNLPS
jgi:hypothetical protein